MSENLNRGFRDFSKYDTMEIEELEEILRLDAEAPEGVESDTELLLYVMEVLARRRNNTNITGNNAQKAWESFQQHYMPEECRENESNAEHKRTATPWLRRLIAAAAVIILVFFIPVSAKALSLDKLWDIFARWAKETFSFVSGEDGGVNEPSPADEDTYTSLQEALADNNRDAKIVPTWVPNGFSLEKIEHDSTPVKDTYRAFYINNDKELKIRIQSYLESDSSKIEINEELIEIYKVSNIEYYIFANNKQNRAVWIIDSYECYISGDLTVEEIKRMIDSIGKG